MKKIILVLCLLSSSVFADDFSGIDARLHGVLELKTNSDHTIGKFVVQTANPAWNSALTLQREDQKYDTNPYYYGVTSLTEKDMRASLELTYTERWLTMGVETSHREISADKGFGDITKTNNVDFIIRANF